MLVRIVEDFNAVEGWGIGDVVDITDPAVLLREGKVVDASVKVEEPKVEEAPAEEIVEEAPVKKVKKTRKVTKEK